MVPQAEEWMIERFGKFSRAAKPGLGFAIPLVDKIAYKRSLKESTIRIQPQTAITKDNVHVSLDGAVYTRVHDAFQASYGVDDPENMISVLAQSAMRKLVGNLELDQLFLERDSLNTGIAQALDEATQPWGIRVFRYEIADISVGERIREAMEKQSNAERLRRAEVLESEGYRQRLANQSEGARQKQINESEGERQLLINQSEGERQRKINLGEGDAQYMINLAQGEAESVRVKAEAEAERVHLLAEAERMRVETLAKAKALETRALAEATADGLRMVAKAIEEEKCGEKAVSQRLAEQYLKGFPDMVKNSRAVIVPDRPNDVAGVVATAMSVWNACGAESKDEKNARGAESKDEKS